MIPRGNQRYEIKLLYVHNVHLMWAQICDFAEDNFFQIGLYGVFHKGIKSDNPTYNDIIFSSEGTDSIRQIKELLYKFKKIYFTPVWYNATFHLFNDAIDIFGRIELLDKDGTVYQLDRLICEKDLGYKTEKFEEKINACKFSKPANYLVKLMKEQFLSNIHKKDVKKPCKSHSYFEDKKSSKHKPCQDVNIGKPLESDIQNSSIEMKDPRKTIETYKISSQSDNPNKFSDERKNVSKFNVSEEYDQLHKNITRMIEEASESTDQSDNTIDTTTENEQIIVEEKICLDVVDLDDFEQSYDDNDDLRKDCKKAKTDYEKELSVNCNKNQKNIYVNNVSDPKMQDFYKVNLSSIMPLKDDKLLESVPSIQTVDSHSVSIDMSDMKCMPGFVSNVVTPKLLIHTKKGLFDKKNDLWVHLEECTYNSDFYRRLASMILVPKTLQTAIWPAANDNHSIFVVGPNLSGKTFGIIISLCNLVLETLWDDTKPEARGPLALVICSNIKTTREVEKICNHMLDNITLPNFSKIKVSRIDRDFIDYKNALKLFGRCDILISTLSVVKIVTRQRNPLDLSRLTYLVLEDLDIIEEYYKGDAEKLINICRLMVAAKNDTVDLKIFATSKIWCETMKKLALTAFNPLVCIVAFQEFFMYSNGSIRFTFISKAEKLQHLVKKFSKNFTKRTVIVCIDDSDVLEISESLKSTFYVITATGKDNMGTTMDSYNKWKKILYEHVVLVTCDSQLDLLDITDAECLIHYSLPSTFSLFHKRFTTIMDNIPNLWNSVESVIETEIFIDETNHMQLPKLTTFLADRCGVEFDEETKNIINEVNYSMELIKAKKDIDICEELLNLGKCSNLNCTNRHMLFSDIDEVTNWIPKRGYITFELLHIISPSHYSVRLLKHIDMDGKVTTFERQVMNLNEKMLLFNANKGNHIQFKNPNVGDICSVLLKTQSFLRCQVIHIRSLNHHDRNYCEIHLLDEGRNLTVHLNDLYHLPVELKEINSNVINVRLSGIVPNDKEARWDKFSINVMRLYFQNISEDYYFMKGKIVLAVKNTLWLQSLYCCLTMESYNKVAVISDVKQYILSNRIGTSNPRQLSLIYELCEQSSFEVPKYDNVKKENKTIVKDILPEPQWAHLDDDVFNDVMFSSGLSIYVFYIKLIKWQSLLDYLSDDLMAHVIKYIDDTPFDESVYQVGDYCIVRYTDSKYARARIDEVHEDESNSFSYKCFYVDYGDWSNIKCEDIYPITAKFITQMPFQAIECKLFGLESNDDKSIDLLYDLSYESNDGNVLKQLFSFTLSKSEAKHTDKRYSIALYDPVQMLNRAIVLKELATYINIDIDELTRVDEKLLTFLKEKQELEASLKDNDEQESHSCDKVTPTSSFENLTIDQINKELVFFESEELNIDDQWECTFEVEDYQRLCAQKEFDKKEEPKIVEVPKNFKESDIEEIFKRAHTYKDNPVKTIPTPIFSDHKTPSIRWHESNTVVYFKIDLVGVEDYVLDITKTTLHFETLLRGDSYKFDLELAGMVIVDKCSHSARGLYVYVKLIKLRKKKWNEFVNADYQPKWIRFDYDFYEDDDKDLKLLHKAKLCEEEEMMERTRDDDSDEEECIDDVELSNEMENIQCKIYEGYTEEDFTIFNN